MTKISQLSSIGDSLAIDDQFIIRDVSDVSTPNKSVTISGITRALDLGSAAAPAIAFATDKNSGLYSPGADQVAISTNGTGRLFVDASGNLLVGTNNNSGGLGERLSINGAGLVTQSAPSTNRGLFGTFNGSTQIIGAFDNIPLEFRTNNTERLRITAAGLVGIGTSSPSELLDIDGDGDSYLRWERDGAAGSYSTSGGVLRIGPYFSATARELALYTDNSNSSWVTTGTAENLYLGTNKTARLTITSAGLVGIGTTSPAALLTVALPAATSATVATFSSPSYENVYIAAGNGGTACGIGTVSTSNFNIYTNSSPRMTVDSSGRLLVGTSTSVSNSAGFTPGIQVAGSGALAAASIARYSGDAFQPQLSLQKSRGGISTQSLVSANDTLGHITFEGSDGSSFKEAASIRVVVDGTPGANDMPGLLVFSTTADGASSPTERMRIDSTGLMTLAGPGIKFPATQVASADPNTLDDYEEGTWTPNVGGNATYSKQEGSYTKVGRMVTVRFDMAITTIGTGSTTFISGLPFGVGSAATSEGYGATGYFASLAVNVTTLSCYSVASASNIGFNSIAAAGATASNNTAIFGNSARVQGSVTYFV